MTVRPHIMDKLKSDSVRRGALLVAAVVFVVGLVVALDRQPIAWADLAWWPLALLFLIAVPASLLFNCIEFMLSVRLTGSHIDFKNAMETTVIGSAANLLPIPGSALVKVARMKALGVSYRHGLSMTALTAVVWLGTSFLYAGGWLFATDLKPWVPLVVSGAGAVGLMVAVGAAGRVYGRWGTIVLMVLVRLLLVVVDAMRLLLAAWALSLSATFLQTSVLSASSFLGATVSIVPAGLGIRELFAAAIGPAVGVSVGVAYLVTALNRIAGLALVAPIAVALGLIKKNRN